MDRRLEVILDSAKFAFFVSDSGSVQVQIQDVNPYGRIVLNPTKAQLATLSDVMKVIANAK